MLGSKSEFGEYGGGGVPGRAMVDVGYGMLNGRLMDLLRLSVTLRFMIDVQHTKIFKITIPQTPLSSSRLSSNDELDVSVKRTVGGTMPRGILVGQRQKF